MIQPPNFDVTPRMRQMSATAHARRPFTRIGRNGPSSWQAQPLAVCSLRLRCRHITPVETCVRVSWSRGTKSTGQPAGLVNACAVGAPLWITWGMFAFGNPAAQAGYGRTMKTPYLSYKPRGSGIKHLRGVALNCLYFPGYTAGVKQSFIAFQSCQLRRFSKPQAKAVTGASFEI